MMGFDLVNEVGEEFHFNNAGWSHLIEFACEHGFVWPADAGGEEKASLTASEAASLAGAIERGLGDADATTVASHVSEQLTRRLVTPSRSPLFRSEPIRLDARTIDYWRHFVQFARRGGLTMSF